jgi:predicted transcriptional regulator
MTSVKFTISFDRALHRDVRDAAAASGTSVSAWLGQAARDELATEQALADGLAATAEEHADSGPPSVTGDDRAWVSRVLSDAGVPRDTRAAS